MKTAPIMTIEVRLEVKYGKELFYPQCPRATIFAKLTKTLTLSIHDLAYIESLGFEIKYFTLLAGKPVRIERNA